MRWLFTRLRQDRKGAAVVEFALGAPLMLMIIIGIFDLSHTMYTSSILQGSIQEAARDASIEGAPTDVIDARVTDIVHQIAPGSTVGFVRHAYTDFQQVRQPEDFTDVNASGTCDAGEPFFDANENGRWDPDRGVSSSGNARDAVFYEVTVNFKRVFPIAKLIGQSEYFTMKSATVMRNQPYGMQTSAGMNGNCT